jgi:hypothetical protein
MIYRVALAMIYSDSLYSLCKFVLIFLEIASVIISSLNEGLLKFCECREEQLVVRLIRSL